MTDKNQAVDFENPEAIAEALEAAEVEAAPKAKRTPKPKVVKVTCPNCSFEFDYEIPKSARARGAVAGIPLNEMTDDQLKIEYRNANSVYYKSKKANKNPDTIAKAEARLEAVKAKMEEKGIQPTSRGRAAAPDAQAIANLIMSGKDSAEDIQKFLNSANEDK